MVYCIVRIQTFQLKSQSNLDSSLAMQSTPFPASYIPSYSPIRSLPCPASPQPLFSALFWWLSLVLSLVWHNHLEIGSWWPTVGPNTQFDKHYPTTLHYYCSCPNTTLPFTKKKKLKIRFFYNAISGLMMKNIFGWLFCVSLLLRVLLYSCKLFPRWRYVINFHTPPFFGLLFDNGQNVDTKRDISMSKYS